MTTTMIDGIGADARAILAQFGPRQPVAAYVNGWRSAWTPQEESWFGRKIRISVEPGQPSAARFARVLDVERYDAGPRDVFPFAEERLAAGHEDATIYCSLSTVPLIADMGNLSLIPRWWLAWYWNRPGVPAAARVLDELLHLTGISLPAHKLWAVQYATAPRWDYSAVYGEQDWSR